MSLSMCLVLKAFFQWLLAIRLLDFLSAWSIKDVYVQVDSKNNKDGKKIDTADPMDPLWSDVIM